MCSRFFLPVLLCLCLTSSLRAAGPTPLEQAQEAWQRGEKLFSEGRYRQAMEEFEKGYGLSKKSGFLLNMAECARMMGDKNRAREIYLRHISDFPGSRLRPEVESRCRSLGVGDCAVPAAGKPAAGKPAAGKPAAGKQPAAGKPETSASRPALAADHPGQTKPFLPDKRQTKREPPKRPFYKHWGLWVGVGAAVLAGTITAVVLATRQDEDIRSKYDLTVDFR